jgi:hypothetical protein
MNRVNLYQKANTRWYSSCLKVSWYSSCLTVSWYLKVSQHQILKIAQNMYSETLISSTIWPSLAWERLIGLPSWERPVNRWMKDLIVHLMYLIYNFYFLSLPIIFTVVFQVVSLILFFYLTITSLYFFQTNYYTQIYQFNLLLTSFKLASKTNLSIWWVYLGY